MVLCFAGTSQTVSSKHVLIMDEVDGMAGNEDRGGIQVNHISLWAWPHPNALDISGVEDLWIASHNYRKNFKLNLI